MRFLGTHDPFARRPNTPSHAVMFAALARAAQRTHPAVRSMVVAVALIAAWKVVAATGGTATALPHLFYVPIILAALSCGFRGAALTAAIATVLAGPLMPGEEQSVLNWLVRGAFFQSIGVIFVLALTARDALHSRDVDDDVRTAMQAAAQDRTPSLALRSRVADALNERRFHPVFQPIVRLRDGRLVGFEALTRFDVPGGHGPDQWFRAAHAEGLGVDLELAALEEILRAAQGLDPGTTLTINVSPVTVADPRLRTLLRTHPHGPIVLEITEHEMIENYAALKAHVTCLRSDGIRFAVDDAGSGFSSLHHVVELAPELLKLDASLVQRVAASPVRQALGRAMAEFAEQIGATLVVEGIETEEDLRVWRHLGATAGQGYLLGRPGELGPLVTAWRVAAPPDSAPPRLPSLKH